MATDYLEALKQNVATQRRRLRDERDAQERLTSDALFAKKLLLHYSDRADELRRQIEAERSELRAKAEEGAASSKAHVEVERELLELGRKVPKLRAVYEAEHGRMAAIVEEQLEQVRQRLAFQEQRALQGQDRDDWMGEILRVNYEMEEAEAETAEIEQALRDEAPEEPGLVQRAADAQLRTAVLRGVRHPKQKAALDAEEMKKKEALNQQREKQAREHAAKIEKLQGDAKAAREELSKEQQEELDAMDDRIRRGREKVGRHERTADRAEEEAKEWEQAIRQAERESMRKAISDSMASVAADVQKRGAGQADFAGQGFGLDRRPPSPRVAPADLLPDPVHAELPILGALAGLDTRIENLTAGRMI